MRTPAGRECKHYYADYYRGRNVKECRLIKENSDSLNWRPEDCTKCPIPDILNANASKDLELKLTIKAKWFGFAREHDVIAHCGRHQVIIEDPYIGCPRCNEDRPGLDIFRQALGQSDDD